MKPETKNFMRRDKSDGSEKPVPRSSVKNICDLYYSDPESALTGADNGERVESPVASYAKRAALKSAVSSLLMGAALYALLSTAFLYDQQEIFENSRHFWRAIFG